MEQERTIDSTARELIASRLRAQASSTAPERVAVLSEVDFINDGRSTFLDASLRTLSDLQGPVVWIAGARMTGTGSAPVQELLRKRVSAIVLFGRDGDARATELREVVQEVYLTEDVRTATFLARELATEGTTVVFSPACPSGDGFANYEERAAEFKRAVRDL